MKLDSYWERTRILGIVIFVSAVVSTTAFAQQQPPPAEGCGPWAHWDPSVQRCRRDPVPPESQPGSEIEPTLRQLPPAPDGVIVLKPGGVHEYATTCPEGFTEAAGANHWRFCVDPKHPETIPAVGVPPVAGIPHDKALDIVLRHQQKLTAIPGTQGIGLSQEGIIIHGEFPESYPKEIEGLPVKVLPPRKLRSANHTLNSRVRPVHVCRIHYTSMDAQRNARS